MLVSLPLTKDGEKDLLRAMDATGLPHGNREEFAASAKQIINEAFSIMDWAANETRKRSRIVAVNSDGETVNEERLPGLLQRLNRSAAPSVS